MPARSIPTQYDQWFFSAETSVRSSENYLFSLHIKNFSGSKYPKDMSILFENSSTEFHVPLQLVESITSRHDGKISEVVSKLS